MGPKILQEIGSTLFEGVQIGEMAILFGMIEDAIQQIESLHAMLCKQPLSSTYHACVVAVNSDVAVHVAIAHQPNDCKFKSY